MTIKFSITIQAPIEDKELYKRYLNALLDALSDILGYQGSSEELYIKLEKEEGNFRSFGIYDNKTKEILGYINVREDSISMTAEVDVISVR